MLLIIEGHLGMPGRITNTAFSMHVPLFFLISGYLAKTGRPGAIGKYARRLLVPYAITGVSIAFIEAMKALLRDGASAFASVFGEWIAATAFGSGTNPSPILGIHMIGAIWFLLALFFALSAYEYVSESKYVWPLVLCIFAVGLFSTQYWWLPWSLQPACTALLFLHIGHEARRYGFDPKTIKPVYVFALLVVWIAAIAIDHGQMYIVSNYFKCLPIDLAGAIAGTIVVCFASSKLERLPWASVPLSFFGKYSMPMMCFHLIELNCVPWWDYAALLGLGWRRLTFMLIFIAKICWAVFWIFICRRIPVLESLFIGGNEKRTHSKTGKRS